MYSNEPPVVVVCALIERDGRLLAARRRGGVARAGLWELPGGKIVAGETPDAAIVREITEELGCVVRPLERLPARIHAYDDLTVALLPLCCELLRGEPAAIEHAEIRWVETAELEGLHWSAADLPIVRDFVANSRRTR